MATLAKFRTCVWRWLRQEDGPTAAEYAVLLCLIVVALIGSIVGMAHAMQQIFAAATDALAVAPPA
jgi:pilus assembly protein Flp/PilA